MNDDTIKVMGPSKIDLRKFRAQYVSCVILTQENQILLQKRSSHCRRYPGFVSLFGGKIEQGETPIQALIRELKEELGASILSRELKFFGAITEAITGHSELIYEYFWHDQEGKIQGCYEESPLYFENVSEVLKSPHQLMPDIPWALRQCQNQGWISE